MRRMVLLFVLGAVVLLFVALLTTGCALSAPGWRGGVTPHFDGEKFHNDSGVEPAGTGDLLKWIFTRHPGEWSDFTDAPPGPPPPERVDGGGARVTFINHASVLIQVDGKNILTDPIWSERASPVGFAGPRRRRPPGIRIEDLPPLDAVLVSHNHYDHMDLASLRELAREHRAPILVGLGNGALFEREGIAGGVELDWWQSFTLPSGLRITAVPAQHFSGRGLFDRNETLWTGYVVEAAGGPIFFAGDTGFGPHFAEIRERFGVMRGAILPIGAYLPEWFMGPIHVTPEQAVEAHRILGARASVAIHFGTFPLADDGEREPVETLGIALDAARVPRTQFWVLGFGEGRQLP